MKIQLVSDTHSNTERFRVNPKVDLVLHCGDFTSGVGDGYKEIAYFRDIVYRAGKEFAFVLGNHDYYLESIDSIKDQLIYDGFNLICVGRDFKYKDWTFVGDTLFTNFKSGSIDTQYCQDSVFLRFPDFKYIMKDLDSMLSVTSEDYKKYFNNQYSYIDTYRNKDNVFIVTHFSPTNKLVDPSYIDSEYNSYFNNDLDLTGFKHLAFGHTHQTLRTKIDGCNVYSNSYGYTYNGYIECPKYEVDYIIEL